MAYVPKDWKDLPDETTPIQASDLNHIEQGIGDLNTSIGDLNTSIGDLNTSIGDLNTLNTTNKSSIVGAINEVYQNNEYSTEEKIVGKWIDGKPIYRKVVIIGDVLSSNTETTKVSTGTSDIDKVIRTYGGGFFRNLFLDWNFVNADGWTSLHFAKNDNKFLAQVKTYDLTDAYAILEYTKTTD